MSGMFNTTLITKLKLKFLELNHTVETTSKCHKADQLLIYDLIFGRDILHEIGMINCFKNKTITWKKASIQMKSPDCKTKKNLCNQRKSTHKE